MRWVRGASIRGLPAISPIRGSDYWTPSDREDIISEVVRRIPKPKDGISPAIEDIVKEVEAALSGKPLNEEIVTKKELTDFLRRGGFRGGGDTVAAGTNITITRAGGLTTISSTGGGGGMTTLAANETPNGVTTVFTFPLASAKPSFIIVDNAWQQATSKAGTVNWTWSAGPKTATFTIPPQDDVLGIV